MNKLADWQRMQRGLCGPAWRCHLAEELSLAGSSVHHVRADVLTRDAAQAMSLRNSPETATRASAARRFPKISQAMDLLADDTASGELKVLTLAGCARAEIAARLGLSEEVVVCFEGLFFDVREMLSCTAWVHGLVIRRESEAGAYDLASKLRVAFRGGKELARKMCDAQIQVPTDETERIVGRGILFHAALCAALDMPLSGKERIGLVEVYCDYHKHKDLLQLEREKLVLQYAAEETAGADPSEETKT